ncbi:MAG: DNA-binding protein [Proteobacteria bacterium]|nr:MAG: DNA-binding protein [Pseudomonadota bacterium]
MKPLNASETTGPDTLIDEITAAGTLKVSTRALQKWRSSGGGPPFVRLSSRAIRYRRSDLAEWIESRLTETGGKASTH